MATTESDYYELLGVPRNASDADIKRAFRALARELHPDVSGEADAELRFREVAEAYEVLSDSERRATYDRFGKAGLRRGGFEPMFADFGSLADVFASFFGEDLLGGAARQRQSGQRGGDVQATIEIELEDAFTGIAVSAPVRVALPCERCAASGAEPGTSARACPTCGGARGRANRLAEHLRAVRAAAGVPRVRGRRARSSNTPAAIAAATGASSRRRSWRSTCRGGFTTASRFESADRGTPGSAAPTAGTPSSSSAFGRIRGSSATETICTPLCA